MANFYVWSGATGSGTGATWVNAFTTLAAAATADAAGDTIYVAHDHAETQATAITITSSGTAALPVRVLCANRAGSVPPVSADLRTTATVTTTVASAISTAGIMYIYGITFNCGTGAVASVITFGASITLVNCALKKLGTTAAAGAIASTAGTGFIWLHNTPVTFGNVGDSLSFAGFFRWTGTASAVLGSVPTTLFASSVVTVFVEGVDLSALGGGKTLVSALASAGRYTFKDCKLGASVTFAATPTQWSGLADLINCDSGDTNYRNERVRFSGTQTIETTIIRTSGASNGTTGFAWKIIPSANSFRHAPFEAFPISIWNETIGSAITVTVEGIWGGGAVPTNDQIWIDVEYLGTSGFPLGSWATSGPADQLIAGTNLPAGSGTWGGSTTKFKLTTSITPQEKGPITVYVKAATASTTFYVDPLITVT